MSRAGTIEQMQEALTKQEALLVTLVDTGNGRIVANSVLDNFIKRVEHNISVLKTNSWNRTVMYKSVGNPKRRGGESDV